MCLQPFLMYNPTAIRCFKLADNYVFNGTVYSPAEPVINSIFNVFHTGHLTGVDYNRGSFSAIHCKKCNNPYTREEILTICESNFITLNGSRIPIYITAPCAKCIECCVDRQHEYTNRALIEASYSGTCVFFTLTYDDDHLPVVGVNTHDISAHIKRFRRRLDTYNETSNKEPLSVRVLYCGEYGRKSGRPHYHGILFYNRYLDLIEFNHILSIWNACWECSPEWFKTKYSKDNYSICHNLEASTRYICKYITKQFYCDVPAGKNKCFIRGPHQIGLGGLYINDLEEDVMNSIDGKIKVKVRDKVVNVVIPKFIRDKFFPCVSRFCSTFSAKMLILPALIRLLSQKMSTKYYVVKRLVSVQNAFNVLSNCQYLSIYNHGVKIPKKLYQQILNGIELENNNRVQRSTFNYIQIEC